MKKFVKAALAACAALAATSPAAAAQFYCDATTVSAIATRSDGYIAVTAQFGTFYPCTVNGTFGNVTADNCRAWLSQMLSAQGLGKTVRYFFDTAHSSNSGMTSPYCTSTNFGQARVPFYVEILF